MTQLRYPCVPKTNNTLNNSSFRECFGSGVRRLLTYLYPWLPVGHRPSTNPTPTLHPPPLPSHPPSHSVLGCSCHSGPVGPLLFQLCFSVSPPAVARPAYLPLPLRVPGQGLACGPSQHLLGYWFLPRSLPQIFILDLLLPLDFVVAPQTGVEECLDFWFHRLCCPPCLTSVEQD